MNVTDAGVGGVVPSSMFLQGLKFMMAVSITDGIETFCTSTENS